MRLRPGCLVAVLVCAVGVSGCGGAGQVTTDTRISLSGQTQEQRIDLADLTVTVEVPVELGSLRPDNRAGDCPTSRESFGTIPTGSTDHDPKLFFATTSDPCPDEQSVIGHFPTWASVGDLPPERQKVPVVAPKMTAYRFSIDYTQCTNECYARTYDVVFVTLDGSEQTFWVQSTGLDIGAVDAILESVTVE